MQLSVHFLLILEAWICLESLMSEQFHKYGALFACALVGHGAQHKYNTTLILYCLLLPHQDFESKASIVQPAWWPSSNIHITCHIHLMMNNSFELKLKLKLCTL